MQQIRSFGIYLYKKLAIFGVWNISSFTKYLEKLKTLYSVHIQQEKFLWTKHVGIFRAAEVAVEDYETLPNEVYTSIIMIIVRCLR
jgi:hypothetical protein